MMLNQFYIRIIFPHTVYTSGRVKQDSVGAVIWEWVKVKRLEAARRTMQPAEATPPQAEDNGGE